MDGKNNFKIIDFNIDILDNIEVDNSIHTKNELKIEMTVFTDIPVCIGYVTKEDLEKSITNALTSLVSYRTMKKLLFVCEGNAQRSPSFEKWFKENRPKYEVKSTGTAYGYPERLNEEILKWADRIFLMDREQIMFFKRKFPEFISKCEIIGCSDQYDREGPQINGIIRDWVIERGL